MNLAEPAPVPSDRLVLFTDQLRVAVAAYLACFTGPSGSAPNPTCAAARAALRSCAQWRTGGGAGVDRSLWVTDADVTHVGVKATGFITFHEGAAVVPPKQKTTLLTAWAI
jgi:hypothetical protein